MYGWRHLTRGLRALIRAKTADQDISDEVASYYDEAVAAARAKGLSEAAALRAVRVAFGNTTSVREQVRSTGWENAVRTLYDSCRYSIRRLRQSPGFTGVSLLMLALGIGASTAIFSVVDAVLLKPLPFPHAEQLVSLRHTAPGVNIKVLNMAPSLYYTYRDENRVFQDLGMWSTSTSSVTGMNIPEEVPVLMVTEGLLPLLGVQPAVGRGFTAADADPKGAATMMLSGSYWRSHFGGDPGVLGRRMMIDGESREVIGVLPEWFQFMDQKFALMMPLQFDRTAVQLVNFGFQGIARLKPGVTLQQATADVARMVPMAPAKFPPNRGWSANAFNDARIGPNLISLKDELVGDTGKTLWILMGAVMLVLLIACANVANLSLVRVDGRQQELAIRAALGGGRVRITGEMLIESILLALGAGGLGLAIAYAALRILTASTIADLPRLASVAIDSGVLVFALGISLLAGVLFGLIPILKYARPQFLQSIKSGGRALSASKDRHRARSVLVIVQVALAVILLVSSGLMIRTFQALRGVDPGFSGAKEVQTLTISIPESQAKEPERVIRVEEEMLRKLENVGGVISVAMSNTAPMDGGANNPVYVEGMNYREGSIPAIRRFKYISPGYVATAGSRLIAGRELTWAETYGQSPVALVSENLAREIWGDARAALGKRIRPTLKDDWREVIGVVADLHDKGIDQDAASIAYWPLLARNFDTRKTQVQRSVVFLIRTPRAGSTALLEEVRQAVWSVNRDLPLANVRTLEAIYNQSLARTSLTLILLAVSGVMALLLGVVGVYSVIAYSVSQRTREIGIRLALGAPVREVTQMFVRHGAVLSAVGVACGMAAAFALTRLMKALLYGVSPADPGTFVAVAAGLMAVVVLASYLPARRAARVDPVEALRAE